MISRFLAKNSVAILLTLFFLGSSSTAKVSGQQIIINGQPAQPARQIYRSVPIELRRPLILAKRAIAEEHYQEAVEYLGALLALDEIEEIPVEDYFLVDSANPKNITQLKAEVMRLLRSLPPKGREFYELKFGAEARAQFNAALAVGTPEKLMDVVRRYAHTNAGQQAILLLGRYRISQARPLAAAMLLRQLHESTSRKKFEPELSILLATAWRQADMKDRCQEVLLSLKKLSPNASVEFGGTQHGLFDTDEEAVAWLDKLLGKTRAWHIHPKSEWTMFRGAPDRTAQANGSVPMYTLLWKSFSVFSEQDEKIVEKTMADYGSSGYPNISSIQPIAVGDYVMTRAGGRIVGLDAHSGKIVWTFPFTTRTISNSSTRIAQTAQVVRESQLRQRLWDDATYGQISSNGETVYLLDQLGYADSTVKTQSPYNVLVALNVSAQGKQKWYVGGSNGEDEPKLAGAFFLGVPIPHEGDLYALAEIKGQIVMVVLDADNGQLKWQQQLVQIEGTNKAMDIRRRVAGASPSIAGNVLICPTGNGAVIAIDITTRSLLWGYQYTDVVNVAISPYSTTDTHQIGHRWIDYAPTIVDGRVLLTPAESNKLYCLDLVTGEPAWEAKPRANYLFTACAHKSIAIVATEDGLAGLRLSDGTEAWVLKLGRTPTGRGFQNGNLYYYPAGKTLHVVNIDEGKVVKEVKTQHALGNLICYRDKVISQSPTGVVAYYQSEPLRERIPLLLKENPEDVEALALLGQLQLNDGERRQAIETFRRAHTLNPADATTQKLLFTTLLESLKDDFDHAAPLMDELQKLIRHPEQKVAYLRLLATGYQKAGKTVDALNAYIQLTELEQARQLNIDPTKIPLEHIAENLLVRGDRWLRQRLSELLAATPAANQAKVTELVTDQWTKVNEQDSIRATRQFVAYFGSHPVGDEARLNLAVKLTENESYLEAELILDDLTNSGSDQIAGQASAQLAKMLAQLNRFDSAVAFYRQLSERFKDVVCLDGKTGKEIATEAMQRDDMKPHFNRPYNWPGGIVENSNTGDQLPRSPSYYRSYSVNLRESRGAMPAGTNITLDQQRQNLIFKNALGETMHQISIRRPDNRSVYTGNYHLTHAKARGHLVVAFFGYELIAIDLLKAAKNVNEAVIWRADLLPVGTSNSSISRRIMQKSISSPWGLPIYYPTDQHSNRVGEVGPITPWGICYQKQSNLVCVSPTTGLTVWMRNSVPAGSMLLGDEEHLIVVPPNTDEALVISHIDGTIVRKIKIDRTFQWWHSWSRYSLSWKTSDGKQVLRSTDLVTGQPVWEKEFGPNSKGYIVNNNEVAVMESDGAFTVMALDAAEPKLTTKVEPEPGLQSIFVTRSSDQYFLLANRPRQPNTENIIQPVPPGYNPAWVNAKVYAFDHAGKSQWELPAEINDFGFPLDQPDDSPFLLFMRHRTPRTGVNRKPRTSVACINKKDGSLAFFDDSIDITTHMYSLIARPEKNEVVLMLPGKSFTFKFTEDPGPPEPRAYVGQIVSTRAKETTSSPNVGPQNQPPVPVP